MRKGWQTVKLGEVAKICDGTHSTVKDSPKGEYYLLSCKNLKDGQIYIGPKERKIDLDTLLNLRKRTRTNKGDILLSSVGTLGELAIIKDENPSYEFQRSVILLKPHLNLISSFFLYYMLKYKKQSLIHLASGSVQQCIFIKPIKNLDIPLPPLEEQERIASILSAFDDKIEVNNKICNDLEALAKLLFNNKFTANPNKDSWPVAKLSDIAEFVNGLPMQKYRPKDGEPFYNVIKIKELRTGFTDQSERCTQNIPEKNIIHNGDMIFSWSGTLDICLWFNGIGGLNQHLFKVTSDKYPQWFYYLWTLHYLPTFQAIARDKTTTMGHIQRKHLDEALVPLPPAELLAEFEAVVAPLFAQIKNLQQQNASLASTRDLLLPRLMKGEV